MPVPLERTVADGHRRLTVFTRTPTPGKAKTRLVPALPAAGAAALQRAMTEDLLERFGRHFGAGAPTGPPAGGCGLEVRCDGVPTTGTLDIPAGWAVTPQGSGDLGERLRRTARAAARARIDRLVVVGSDAPLLPTPLPEAAFSVLADRDVALAPAEDGGYVLIGLAPQRIPEAALDRLFSGIPWGTDAVLTATRRAVDAAGLHFGELPGHWDVDRPEDLPRLAAAVRALDPAARPSRTAALLNAAGF